MNIALIMCAGSGKRMNLATPKQFIEINKKPIFIYTVEKFVKSECIDKVILVINKDDDLTVNRFLKKHKLEHEVKIVYGGKTRQKSVFNGLKSIYNNVKSDDIVLIHDAARANVSFDIIQRNIDGVKEFNSAITAIKINDTIAKINEHNSIEKFVNRDELISIQTPQSFYYKDILEAHEKCAFDNYEAVTDDSSVALYAKMKLKIVQGSKFNIKVTTQDDLELLKLYLENKIN